MGHASERDLGKDAAPPAAWSHHTGWALYLTRGRSGRDYISLASGRATALPSVSREGV